MMLSIFHVLLRHPRSFCFSAILIFPHLICIIYYLLVTRSTAATAVVNFTNESCVTGGVKPSDSLLFTCEINEAFLLRVVFPTGQQEIITIGDTADDVVLPPGYTAVSLNITDHHDLKSNFKLTLLIDRASRLESGEITCDDTTERNAAKAGCLGKHIQSRLEVTS